MLEKRCRRLAAVALAALAVVVGARISAAASYATNWIEGHNSRSRVLVGGAIAADGTIERYIAFEVALAPGWKTYWRQPGSAGGIPPHFDWAGSQNLKGAAVKYPAPTRMIDPTGATIGYKHGVVFPIRVQPENPTAPVKLKLSVFFGVCRDICIPADAKFELTIPPTLFNQTPTELAQALARVPVNVARSDSTDAGLPVLVATAKSNAQRKSGAAAHTLTFDVRFAAGSVGADLFAETGDGQSLAMSSVVARTSADTVRYEVAVKDPSTWQALLKSGLILTMVSEQGAREVQMPLP